MHHQIEEDEMTHNAPGNLLEATGKTVSDTPTYEFVWHLGRDACNAGQAITDNPFSLETERSKHADWHKGFEIQQRFNHRPADYLYICQKGRA